MGYPDGLATTLAGAAVPYGYSLLIWTSGALAAQQHGRPQIENIVSFACGAAAAYVVLRLATRHSQVHRSAGLVREGLLKAGAIHLASIALSILAAAYAARLGGDPGWFVPPLAVTGIYLAGTAVAETLQLHALDG